LFQVRVLVGSPIKSNGKYILFKSFPNTIN